MFQIPNMLDSVGARPVPVTNISLPDILEVLDSMMARKVGICYKHMLLLRLNRSELRGPDVVTFLLDNKFSETTHEAILFAHFIVRSGGLTPTYRVLGAESLFVSGKFAKYTHRGQAHLKVTHELNKLIVPTSKPVSLTKALRDVASIARELRERMFTSNGKYVKQFSEVRGSAVWRKLLVVTTQLAFCYDDNLHGVDDDEKQSLFANLFNIMIFHGRMVNGHPTSFRSRLNLLHHTAYSVAEKHVSAYDIMYGILRGKLKSSDDLYKWQLANATPHTSLVLNWGFHSSPAFEYLDPSNVEGKLLRLTKEYIDNEVIINKEDEVVELPRLLKWIGPDFTESTTRFTAKEFLTRLSAISRLPAKKDLNKAVNDQYMIKYRRFNWADYADQDANKRGKNTLLLDRLFRNMLSYER